MHLKMRVKAGILLYALLMTAIFTLFLQFYLNRLVSVSNQHHIQLKGSQAYLMAQLTADMANDKEGKYQFNLGKTNYRRKGENLEVEKQLTSGQNYSYKLFSPQIAFKNELEDVEQENSSDKKEK